MNDENFVMVQYMHPNRGQHRVTGATTKMDYGYRGGGEQFLVHVDDIKAQPNLFRPVNSVPTTIPQRVIDAPPPPPVMISPDPVKVVPERPLAKPTPAAIPDFLNDVQKAALAELDLQALPGVTPAIERGLRDARLTTASAILLAGVDGLEQVRYVGHTKATAIHQYIMDKYGPA